jgi:hypothetical protein
MQSAVALDVAAVKRCCDDDVTTLLPRGECSAVQLHADVAVVMIFQ